MQTAAVEAGRDADSLRFICRGVVRVRAGEHGFLTGTYDQIKEDLATVAQSGVSETFLDLNFDPELSSPTADPDASVARAMKILETLVPRPPASKGSRQETRRAEQGGDQDVRRR